jgi:hypothetical protein
MQVKKVGAQAKKPNTVLLLPSVPVLREHLRRILYNDALCRVTKATNDRKVFRRLEKYLRVA